MQQSTNIDIPSLMKWNSSSTMIKIVDLLTTTLHLPKQKTPSLITSLKRVNVFLKLFNKKYPNSFAYLKRILQRLYSPQLITELIDTNRELTIDDMKSNESQLKITYNYCCYNMIYCLISQLKNEGKDIREINNEFFDSFGRELHLMLFPKLSQSIFKVYFLIEPICTFNGLLDYLGYMFLIVKNTSYFSKRLFTIEYQNEGEGIIKAIERKDLTGLELFCDTLLKCANKGKEINLQIVEEDKGGIDRDDDKVKLIASPSPSVQMTQLNTEESNQLITLDNEKCDNVELNNEEQFDEEH